MVDKFDLVPAKVCDPSTIPSRYLLKFDYLITNPTKVKSRSDVWEHFKKVGVGEAAKAHCNYCRSELNGNSGNGTLALRRHLERCKNYAKCTKQTMLKLSGGNSAPSN
ncbi:hypothetical protein PGT21_004837 [Puccinia graminis f. sp. tritici]|uniref:BED-type domain-containing protein n=1 Tax=Puccinia graminis f. sp. tritici TaxID=56615 RepID=A0A5B0P7B8_PUCGR|nr:hypothetical protein PGT21_004837 [Puccinia graminis f. sp. tritici]